MNKGHLTYESHIEHDDFEKIDIRVDSEEIYFKAKFGTNALWLTHEEWEALKKEVHDGLYLVNGEKND